MKLPIWSLRTRLSQSLESRSHYWVWAGLAWVIAGPAQLSILIAVFGKSGFMDADQGIFFVLRCVRATIAAGLVIFFIKRWTIAGKQRSRLWLLLSVATSNLIAAAIVISGFLFLLVYGVPILSSADLLPGGPRDTSTSDLMGAGMFVSIFVGLGAWLMFLSSMPFAIPFVYVTFRLLMFRGIRNGPTQITRK